ncbi:MAG: glutaminyl-peptide cyclotransferase [Desulfovibrio sp.]
MRPVLAVLCLLFLTAGPLLAGQTSRLSAPDTSARTQPASILARLPHHADAFTQGLLLHQGSLYESTGLYGQSSLRKTDPATGRTIARRDLPRRLFGEGLALCGTAPQRLVQLTWREGVILVYDPASLRRTGEARLRGQGWGLACQGAELVLSDGTDTLRFLDAKSLAETGETRRVRDGARPVERLNELEWVNGWLVANIWKEDRLAVIRPGGGDGIWRVALWLDLAPLRRELSARAESANGVAFDPAGDGGKGALYLTGKRWDTLFVVALPTLMREPPQRAGR